MRKTDNYTFFWTVKDVFSNYYPAKFIYKNIVFNCTEQFLMYAKAKTFNDNFLAQKLLNELDPKIQKDLGNLVANYVDEVWEKKKEKVMYIACYEKFKQNPDLLEKLLETENTTLVEASANDKEWGIGMKDNDIGINNSSNWNGQNKLGYILTRVRDELKREIDLDSLNYKI